MSQYQHENLDMVTLRLPDPWNSHNLNVYSESPLDLPEWCTRRFLGKYVYFVEKRRADFVSANSYIYDFSHIRKDYTPTLILRRIPRDKDKTVGVIGAGLFGTGWLRLLVTFKDLQVRAVADRNVYNAFLAANTCSCEVCTSDAGTVLEDKSIDIVFIVTHHSSHTSSN